MHAIAKQWCAVFKNIVWVCCSTLPIRSQEYWSPSEHFQKIFAMITVVSANILLGLRSHRCVELSCPCERGELVQLFFWRVRIMMDLAAVVSTTCHWLPNRTNRCLEHTFAIRSQQIAFSNVHMFYCVNLRSSAYVAGIYVNFPSIRTTCIFSVLFGHDMMFCGLVVLAFWSVRSCMSISTGLLFVLVILSRLKHMCSKIFLLLCVLCNRCTDAN